MNRANPTFKQQTQSSEEDLAFIDELFDSLFDNDDITSDTDRIPNLAALHDAA
jgi:hypothetical protein